MLTTALLSLVLMAGAAEKGRPAKPKLIVLELTGAGGVEPGVASALTETVTTELGKRGFFDVISSKDLQTLMGVERQKQLVGCAEDSSSCMAELAGALGARFVVSGSVAKLGPAYQLSLQALDTQKAQPIGRTTRIAPDLAALRAQMPHAVAEATATPLPPPPSRVMPYTAMAIGALAVVTGGVIGQSALSKESAVEKELSLGAENPSLLKPLPSYEEEVRDIQRDKAIAVLTIGLGAAMIGAGLYFNPADPASNTSVALVPAGLGFAVVGGLP